MRTITIYSIFELFVCSPSWLARDPTSGRWLARFADEQPGPVVLGPAVCYMPRWNRTEFEDAVRSVAHSMLITIWHLLANETDYVDLGSDWSDRRDSEQHARRLAHQIERFDYKVTMGPVVAA